MVHNNLLDITNALVRLWNENNNRMKAPILRSLLNFYPYDEISKMVKYPIVYLEKLVGNHRNHYFINVSIDKIEIYNAHTFLIHETIEIKNNSIKKQH